MREFDLTKVFDDCQESASRGYEMAKHHYKNLEKTLINAEKEIANAKKVLVNSPFYVAGAPETMSGQLDTIQSTFSELSAKFLENLENIHYNDDPFKIVLFGKTKAGKSTLMEVLTGGNGDSIGKGDQRTTLEPRSYDWNGLKIVDLPGIDAYGGEEDEQIALEETVTADLVIFVISDDNPGKTEAEFLSLLVNTGKPLLLLFNVKAGINPSNPKRSLNKIKQAFDLHRLHTMKDGFMEYAEIYGQDWSKIPYIFVHLMAAFFAHKQLDPELSSLFEKESRINTLYSRLINEVRTKGGYYKTRTYLDAITVPLVNVIDVLLFQSQENSFQGRTVTNTIKPLQEWTHEYRNNTISRIHSFAESIQTELYREASVFAEDHCTDENANDKWKQIVESYNINGRYNTLLDTIEAECLTKIDNIYRGLEIELEYLSPSFTSYSFTAPRIKDIKRGVDYGFKIAAGICELGSIVASALGRTAFRRVLGISGIVLAFAGEALSLIFEPYAQKIDEARSSLQRQLEQWIDKTTEQLERNLKKNLDIILEASIKKPIVELNKLCSTIFKLADTQKDLAWGLCSHITELNMQIVNEALKNLGMEELYNAIESTARIPGVQTVIMIKKEIILPGDFKSKLHQLSSEWIRIITYTTNKRTLIYKVLGKKAQSSRINIEEKIRIAHVKDIEMSPEMRINFRLAQQLVKLSIVND